MKSVQKKHAQTLHLLPDFYQSLSQMVLKYLCFLYRRTLQKFYLWKKKNIFKDSKTKKIYKILSILFFILNIIIKIND